MKMKWKNNVSELEKKINLNMKLNIIDNNEINMYIKILMFLILI